MSHDVQWIHKGSSSILLWSSMSKVSCLKYKMIEISSSFVTKEKNHFLPMTEKKTPPSDQVQRQIKYQCWHVDKHTRPWVSLFIFPLGVYDAAAFLMMCVTCLYELLYNYLWPCLLRPNSAKNSGAQRDRELGPQISLPT